MLLLDSIIHARLDDDYVVIMKKLKTYNSDLVKWVEEDNSQHWDKMITTLVESFNT